MKNLSIITLPNSRKRLLDKEGVPIDSFNRFLNYLEPKVKPKTFVTYIEYVAKFIDYLVELGVYDAKEAPRQSAIDNAINKYPEFLCQGMNSRDPFVRDIAKKMGRKNGMLNTVPAISAVNHFLQFSQQLARDMLEYMEYEQGVKIDAPEFVFAALKDITNISPQEIKRIRSNSVLGSNLRQIKATRNSKLYGRNSKAVGSVSERDKDFPITRFEELIDAEPCPRNRSFWLLLAGGGLRQSEGVSLPKGLVDCEMQKVRVQDPNDLRCASKYAKKEKMRWKGRETAIVYFIPALKGRFFDAYLEYLKIRPISDAEFLFLKMDRDGYGDALINASNQSLNEAFKKAQERIGMEPEYTLHSLRHMYGVYMKNYFPNPYRNNELGLDAEDVQVLMGHANISSTHVYARTKSEVLQAKLEMMDNLLMGKKVESLPSIIAASYRSIADKLEKQ